jgi:hypothetical protein
VPALNLHLAEVKLKNAERNMDAKRPEKEKENHIAENQVIDMHK